ncbi:McrB family protein [Pseudomonas halotolerans]|uniref:McrB family protein n=1 Tax=Pseudomonas halotolerans TaxID=3143552 RepID=UPI0031DBE69E
MSLTNDEIFEMASTAVRAMHQRYGPDFKFPADVIWQNMPYGVDIPSTKRPHQPARLIRAGLLEKTGGLTKAQSESRAGSPTAEYRFGPELVPRAKAPSESQAFSKRSTSESLAAIQVAMDSEGYVISVAELANFYLAITVSPLVVLSGISGTGKSLLPRKFAQQTNSFFHAIPVQPQWSDNSDLFGYVPTLSPTKYIKGALIDSLLEAKKNPQKLVIALLDEMNLAPVEHYFSDFLSVAETRVRGDKGVTTDKLPIELPDDVPGQSSPHIDLLRGIQLPPNLRVVGTANMDETTHIFSPKVLDRAFTIEFDDPDLTAFASGQGAAKGGSNAFDELATIAIRETNAISVQEAYAVSQDLFEHIALLLSEIQDILAPAGIKFGYRTRDAILLYLHFWRELQLADILTGYAALDFCILQKILPKVAGSGEALAEALTNLTTWLSARAEAQEDADGVLAEFSGPLARSVQKVERMTELLSLDGSTRYWGA